MAFTEHNTHNKRRSYPMGTLERRVYGRYQKIVCVSQGTRAALTAWLGAKSLEGRLDIILNASRMLQFSLRPHRPHTGIRLVSVGSLTRQKGFDIALRAVAFLGDQVERYTIVGEGGEHKKLEALAKELGIRHKVTFEGYRKEVTPFLHEADLGLMPSRWEGFGLVVVEALSTGLPLVASDVEGMREVVEGCPAVKLAEAEDVSAWVEGIQQASNELVGREKIADAARKHAEAFQIEGVVERYAGLYYDMLQHAR